MTLYFILVFGCYFGLLVMLRLGWQHSVARAVPEISGEEFISIVVATRNEAHNLKNLIDRLAQQDYPTTSFEVILVDDHSTDGTVELAKVMKQSFDALRVVSLPSTLTGKKAALAHGIALAKGKIISTTDADCSVPVDWLRIINSTFKKTETQMAIGLVAMAGESFFARWQAMEFASVIGTGAATLGLGFPTMCNGANLSFRKDAFEAVNGYEGNNHIASGDDEFLMRKIINRFPRSLALLNDPGSVVITQAQPSPSDFIRQRLRWAGKWKHNSSPVAKALAVYIFLVQVSFIMLWFYWTNPLLVIILIAAKVFADLFFLVPVFRFLKIRFQVIPFIAVQFLYPVYVVIIALFSQWKSSRWKGRSIP